LLLATLAASVSVAHADTVAMWTFESSVPAAAGPFAAEVGSGQALGSHANGATVYSNPVGNGSAESFSSDKWAVGDYYQFSVSTIGFADLVLSWDQTSSNTGPRDFRLAYSLDGTAFNDVASYSVLANASPNPTWSGVSGSALYTFTQNLASIDALENQTIAFFRLIDSSAISANGGTVASGGTNRVDNFTVSASVAPVPVPAAVWLLGSGLLGLVGAGRRRRAKVA
jgi:hypothetical protein